MTEPETLRPHEPALACAHLPGVGGAIGSAPEDFLVDEVPAYEPSGDGPHVYVRLKKRDWTTPAAVRAVARAAGVAERDVGSAGMKDRHAVTTQWLSLPERCAPVSAWELPEGLEVVESSRHGNKLRTGHLRGNRFTITLRDTVTDALPLATAIIEQLERAGLPNCFGAQRFGRGGDNVRKAVEWLRSGGAKNKRARFERKLYPSVLQAEVFNRYTEARLARGTEQLLGGEIVRLDGAGATFVVEDPAREEPRLRAGDIHLTGPIFGPRGDAPSGEARELERAALDSLNLSEGELETVSRLARGTRRDLLVRPGGLSVRADGDALVVSFELASGSYATQLVRELTRTPFLDAGRAH